VTDQEGNTAFDIAGDSHKNLKSYWCSFEDRIVRKIKTIISLTNYGLPLNTNTLDNLFKTIEINSQQVPLIYLRMSDLIPYQEIRSIPLEEKLLSLKIIVQSMRESTNPKHNQIANSISTSFDLESALQKIYIQAKEHIHNKKTYLINIDTISKLHKFFPEHKGLNKINIHLNKCAASTVIKFFFQELSKHLNPGVLNEAQALIKNGLAEENITQYLDLDSLSAILEASKTETIKSQNTKLKIYY